MFAHGTIFINALDSIDCALFDHRTGIIGQSWYLDVQAQGSGDHNYFVSDFKEIKTQVRDFVRLHLDHRLLLPTHVTVRQQGDTWQLGTAEQTWTYTCPPAAVLQLPLPQLDRPSIASWLTNALQQHLGDAPRITASLRQLNTDDAAYFHYTHGLPGHTGNCQRLLHGHLGAVQVQHNGVRQPALEKYLWDKILPCHNVHFLNSQHAVIDDKRISMAYESSQGYFAVTFPRRHAVVLPQMESSIEAITHYFAQQLRQHGVRAAEVICYEGMDKGARCWL